MSERNAKAAKEETIKAIRTNIQNSYGHGVTGYKPPVVSSRVQQQVTRGASERTVMLLSLTNIVGPDIDFDVTDEINKAYYGKNNDDSED
jgi:hypothetical protein